MNRVILRNIINDVLYLKNLIYLKKNIYLYFFENFNLFEKRSCWNKKYLIDVYIFSNIGKF